jgi:uncharacterized membrane protein YedE/YeeE
MISVIGSLVIGLIVGFLGQRSRMCFVGGFRDFLMIGDKDFLKGAIAFFASAWFTIWLLSVIGKLIPEWYNVVNVKYVMYPSFLSAFFSKFGIVSIIGGLGLGLFSTLAGGCPLRQHVMAGQGRIDSIVYLLGFYIGIIIYYVSTVKFIALII